MMTTYKLIDEMIEKKLGNIEIAEELIFDAYYHDRIDGIEYEELIKKASARYWR